jgi:hypothetical protein
MSTASHPASRSTLFSARKLLLAAGLVLAAPLPAQEKVDVATVERIKAEAMQHSQVMELMSWLSDVYGPRLTWSENTRKAGDWAMATMKGWGLANVHTENWNLAPGMPAYPAMGWQNERFTFVAVSPNPFIVQAVPRAWSAGTKGKVLGGVTVFHIDSTTTLASLQKQYAGKLRNQFIMITPAANAAVTEFQPYAARLADAELALMAAEKPQSATSGYKVNMGGQLIDIPSRYYLPVQDSVMKAHGTTGTPTAADSNAVRQVLAVLVAAYRGAPSGRFNPQADTAALRWMEKEGVGAILMPNSKGYVGGDIATDNGASRARNAPQVPMVHVANESYGRIYRMAEKKVPVMLELDMQNRFVPADTTSFNILGEIPGTDPALKDEVVLIGAHFDSWHSGTGATDNGAGTGTMMEAMRILKALDLKPRRTIRIGLWTGEEQGLLGSLAYTKAHFGARDATGFHPTPEHQKFDVYFNVDNGGGKIRGIYIEGIEAERPIFDAWMAPFRALGMNTITIGSTSGTDHQSFVTPSIGVGLPGFQFIQDGLDYGTRTHHTNQDVWERLQPDDMKFNSAVVASFAWLAAQRDQQLPRPPLPAAAGAPRGGQ